jgi:hypothetical protein
MSKIDLDFVHFSWPRAWRAWTPSVNRCKGATWDWFTPLSRCRWAHTEWHIHSGLSAEIGLGGVERLDAVPVKAALPGPHHLSAQQRASRAHSVAWDTATGRASEGRRLGGPRLATMTASQFRGLPDRYFRLSPFIGSAMPGTWAVNVVCRAASMGKRIQITVLMPLG